MDSIMIKPDNSALIVMFHARLVLIIAHVRHVHMDIRKIFQQVGRHCV